MIKKVFCLLLFCVVALIAAAQEVEFTAATPSQNPPKFPIKILASFFGKNQ